MNHPANYFYLESVYLSDDALDLDHGRTVICQIKIEPSDEVLVIRWRFADQALWRSPDALSQGTYNMIEREVLNA